MKEPRKDPMRWTILTLLMAALIYANSSIWLGIEANYRSHVARRGEAGRVERSAT